MKYHPEIGKYAGGIEDRLESETWPACGLHDLSSPASIETLDSEVQELEEYQYQVTAAIRRHILTLQRRRNEMTALMRLPREILTLIVKESLSPLIGYKYYVRLNALATVSHQWNCLVDEPFLWTQCSADLPKGIVTKIFLKSKENMLDIVVPYPGKQISFFVQQVLVHRSRWGSLSLHFNRSGYHNAVMLLNGVAPNLERIHIFANSSRDIADFLGGSAPLLKDVELDGISIPWNGSMLSSLKSLKLNNLKSTPPSAERILDIIAASPHLIELHLGYTIFPCSTLPTRRVLMPSLSNIHIAHVGACAFFYLLTCLEAPNCESTYVRYAADVDLEMSPASPPLPTIPQWAVKTFSQDLSPITAVVHSNSISYRCPLDNEDLFQMTGLTPEEIIFYLNQDHLKPYQLRCFLRGDFDTAIPLAVSRLENVVSLHLDSWSTVEMFLECFIAMEKDLDHGGSLHYLLPRLQHFSVGFYGDDSADDVLELITRYLHSPAKMKHTLHPGPSRTIGVRRLTRVDVSQIETMTDEIFSQLEEIFGIGVIEGYVKQGG